MPRCSQCGRELEKYEGGFGGVMEQYGGVHCPHCCKIWCDACHPPARGQKCPECAGQLECVFGRSPGDMARIFNHAETQTVCLSGAHSLPQKPLEDESSRPSANGERSPHMRQEARIVARCPHCSRGYQLPAGIVGRKAKCKCGKTFVVTELEEPGHCAPNKGQAGIVALQHIGEENTDAEEPALVSASSTTPHTVLSLWAQLARLVGIDAESRINRLGKKLDRLLNSGRAKAAISVAACRRDLVRQHRGETHPDYAISVNDLAVARAAAGEYTDAESLLLEVVRLRQTTPHSDKSGLASALCNLATLYLNQKNHAAAEPLYREALHLDPDEPNLLYKAGCFFYACGNYIEAAPWLQKTWDRIRNAKSLAEISMEALRSNNLLPALARSQYLAQNYGASEAPLQQMLQNAAEQSDEVGVRAAQLNLAAVYQMLGRSSEANSLVDRVKQRAGAQEVRVPLDLLVDPDTVWQLIGGEKSISELLCTGPRLS